MTQVVEGRVLVTLTEEAVAVQGRDGPQWKLKVQYPWSQYPQDTWIDQGGEGSEGDNRPQAGEYWCMVRRGLLLDGKDGTREFHYRHWINSIGVDDAVPEYPVMGGGDRPTSAAIHSPSSAQHSVKVDETPFRDPTRDSIERQVALKEARLFFGEVDGTEGHIEQLTATILGVADDFYAWLSRTEAVAAEVAPKSAQQPNKPPPEPAQAQGTAPEDTPPAEIPADMDGWAFQAKVEAPEDKGGLGSTLKDALMMLDCKDSRQVVEKYGSFGQAYHKLLAMKDDNTIII